VKSRYDFTLNNYTR